MSPSLHALLWLGALIWTAIGTLELFARLCHIVGAILLADFWNRWERRHRRRRAQPQP